MTVGERAGTGTFPILALELPEVRLSRHQRILSGECRFRQLVLDRSDDGRIERGVWEVTPGVMTDVEYDEMHVVVSGRATVELVAEARTIELGPGSIGFFTAGARTVWTIHETLRKGYQITYGASDLCAESTADRKGASIMNTLADYARATAGTEDLLALYAPRKVEDLGLWELDGWRLKVYGIAYGRDRVRPEVVAAARGMASKPLPPSDQTGSTGAGFVVLHDAEDGVYALVAWWANNIEIHQEIFFADINDPTNLGELSSSAIGCMYELAVHDFERRLWVELIRADPQGFSVDAYLTRRLTGSI